MSALRHVVLTRHVTLVLGFVALWGLLVTLLLLTQRTEEAQSNISTAGLVGAAVLGAGAVFMQQPDPAVAATVHWQSLRIWCAVNVSYWLINLGLLHANAPQITATVFGIGRLLSLGPVAAFAYRGQRYLNGRGHLQWLPPFSVAVAVVVVELRGSPGVVVAWLVLLCLRVVSWSGQP